MSDNETKQTFWEHLDVLRGALIKIIVVAILFGVLAFCFKEILFETNKGMTVGAILKDERIKAYVRHNGEGVSSQVITAIFTKNPKDFVRTVEKKVAYYSLNFESLEGEGE